MWFNTILLLGVLVTTAIAEQSCVDLMYATFVVATVVVVD